MIAKTEKIAVIGSGPAGLSIAHLLSLNPSYKVHIYEKAKRHGMEAPSLLFEGGNIDAPLRSFCKTYYPTLWSLMRYLNVEIAPADHSLSFSQVDPDKIDANHTMKTPPPIHPFFAAKTFYFSLPLLFSFSLSLPLPSLATSSSFISFSAQWLKLWFHARLLIKSNLLNELHSFTIEEFLKRHHYSQEFIWGFVYPAMATVCSCSVDALRQYPASYILHFHEHHGRSEGWSRLKNGVGEFCRALTSNVDSVFLERGVRAVYKNQVPTATFPWVLEDEMGKKEYYDQVVFASEASTTLSILQKGSDIVKKKDSHLENITKILQPFRYETLEVVIHNDASVLPSHRQDWRAVNIVSPVKELKGGSLITANAPMATIWMNAQRRDQLGMNTIEDSIEESLSEASPIQYFQTQFPIWTWAPAPDKVLHRAKVARALITTETVKSVEYINQIQGKEGLWFCGSYVYPGIPLLEGCVCSALRISESLGIQRPWRSEDGSDFFYRPSDITTSGKAISWNSSNWVGAYFRGELAQSVSNPSFRPNPHAKSSFSVKRAFYSIIDLMMAPFLPALLKFTGFEQYQSGQKGSLNVFQEAVYWGLTIFWIIFVFLKEVGVYFSKGIFKLYRHFV